MKEALKTMNKKNTNIFAAICLVLVVVLGGALYFNSSEGVKKTADVSDLTKEATTGIKTSGELAPINPALISDNTGTLTMSLQNMMSTTSKAYIASNIRIYKKETPNNLFGTIDTISTGNGRATLSIDKYDAKGIPQEYIYYVVANVSATGGANSTSAKGEFTAAESIEINIPIAAQDVLVFKVYDEEARGYLANTSEPSNGTASSLGQLAYTGVSYGSTTTNDTGTTVGQGGYFDYTIYFSQYGTASTTTQFEDQELFIGVDAQDTTDWNKPTLSLPGAVITEVTGAVNSKIDSDGYDWVYKVTKADGTPYHVDSTFSKLRIQEYALSGINPSDDITLGFFTSGYFVHTMDDGIGMSTHIDDSARTIIYPVQTVTLRIS